MRGSAPMPVRTLSMSAPMRSARLASSFMKLILVASMALAAYLVSSDERTSMTIMRSRLREHGARPRRTVLVRRRADRDHLEDAMRNTCLGVGHEPEPPLRRVAVDQLV